MLTLSRSTAGPLSSSPVTSPGQKITTTTSRSCITSQGIAPM